MANRGTCDSRLTLRLSYSQLKFINFITWLLLLPQVKQVKNPWTTVICLELIRLLDLSIIWMVKVYPVGECSVFEWSSNFFFLIFEWHLNSSLNSLLSDVTLTMEKPDTKKSYRKINLIQDILLIILFQVIFLYYCVCNHLYIGITMQSFLCFSL